MDLGDGHGRDLLVALAVVGGILLILFLYTGNWPPPVVVESNSMMHVDKGEYQGNTGDTRAAGVSYGRLGTIDPGDLVLVKDVPDADAVSTFADGSGEHYGMHGEVVVYFTNDQLTGTPIIHRAMTYVEVSGQGADRTYEVRWTDSWDASDALGCEDRGERRICTFDENGVTIPELNIDDREFIQSGFITKGDNPAGNPMPDQVLGIYDQPVPIEQVQGVARGELPWFGLIKLTLTGNPRSTAEVQDHPYYQTFGRMTAPQDLWIMLVVGLGIVGFAPVGIDYAVHYGRRWLEQHRETNRTGERSQPNRPGGPGPDSPGGGSRQPTPALDNESASPSNPSDEGAAVQEDADASQRRDTPSDGEDEPIDLSLE